MTAVPRHQVHNAFVQFQRHMLNDYRKRTIFDRLVEKSQIEKRWSCVLPAEDCSGASINGERFYVPGDFPSTGERMRQYEIEAPVLAEEAVNKLNLGRRAHSSRPRARNWTRGARRRRRRPSQAHARD